MYTEAFPAGVNNTCFIMGRGRHTARHCTGRFPRNHPFSIRFRHFVTNVASAPTLVCPRSPYISVNAAGGRAGDATATSRPTIIAACHAAGFSPRISQEAPRIVSTLNLVAAGLGIALVPASLRRMQMDAVAYRALQGMPQPRAPLLLANRRADTAAVVRRFIDLVRQTARTFPHPVLSG